MFSLLPFQIAKHLFFPCTKIGEISHSATQSVYLCPQSSMRQRNSSLHTSN
jgi:hypothetical protein